MNYRSGVFCLLFCLAALAWDSCVFAVPVVGVCQKRDRMSLIRKKIAAREKEKRREWQELEKQKVGEALKEGNPLPQGIRTLQHKLDLEKSKKEAELFSKKREVRLLEKKLLAVQERIEQVNSVINMSEIDLEDMLGDIDFPLLRQLGFPDVDRPGQLRAEELDELSASLRRRLKLLEGETSDKRRRIAEIRSEGSAAYDYLYLLAGGDHPDFEALKSSLEKELEEAVTSLDAIKSTQRDLTARRVKSRSAMKNTTAPSAEQIKLDIEIANQLKDAAKKRIETELTIKLKRRELFETGIRESLWHAQKEREELLSVIDELKRTIDGLEGSATIARRYEERSLELLRYREEKKTLSKEKKKNEQLLATRRKEEEALVDEIKKQQDELLKEKARIRRQQADDLGALLAKALGAGVDWIVDKVKDAPFVMAALRHLPLATCGYYLEIVKSLIVCLVNIVLDVACVSFPALGFTIGIGISTMDSAYTSAVHGPPPAIDKLRVVLHLSEEASRYYFLDESGEETRAGAIARAMAEYRRFLSSVGAVYKEKLAREKERMDKAAQVTGLIRQAENKVRDLEDRKKEILESLRKKQEALDETKVLTGKARKLVGRHVATRAGLYVLLKQLDLAVSEDDVSYLKAAMAAELEKLRGIASKLEELTGSAEYAQALQNRKRIKQDLADCNTQLSAVSDDLALACSELSSRNEDLQYLLSGGDVNDLPSERAPPTTDDVVTTDDTASNEEDASDEGSVVSGRTLDGDDGGEEKNNDEQTPASGWGRDEQDELPSLENDDKASEGGTSGHIKKATLSNSVQEMFKRAAASLENKPAPPVVHPPLIDLPNALSSDILVKDVQAMREGLEAVKAGKPLSRRAKDAFAKLNDLPLLLKKHRIPGGIEHALVDIRKEMDAVSRSFMIKDLATVYGDEAKDKMWGFINTGSAARQGNPSFKLMRSDLDFTFVAGTIEKNGRRIDLGTEGLRRYDSYFCDTFGVRPSNLDIGAFPQSQFIQVGKAGTAGELAGNRFYYYSMLDSLGDAYKGRGAVSYVDWYNAKLGTADLIVDGKIITDPQNKALFKNGGMVSFVTDSMKKLRKKLGMRGDFFPRDDRVVTSFGLAANEYRFLRSKTTDTGIDAIDKILKAAKYAERSADSIELILKDEFADDTSKSIARIARAIRGELGQWEQEINDKIATVVRNNTGISDKALKEEIKKIRNDVVNRNLSRIAPGMTVKQLVGGMEHMAEKNLRKTFAKSAASIDEMLKKMGGGVTDEKIYADRLAEFSEILGRFNKDQVGDLVKELPEDLQKSSDLRRFLKDTRELAEIKRQAQAEITSEVNVLRSEMEMRYAELANKDLSEDIAKIHRRRLDHIARIGRREFQVARLQAAYKSKIYVAGKRQAALNRIKEMDLPFKISGVIRDMDEKVAPKVVALRKVLKRLKKMRIKGAAKDEIQDMLKLMSRLSSEINEELSGRLGRSMDDIFKAISLTGEGRESFARILVDSFIEAKRINSDLGMFKKMSRSVAHYWKRSLSAAGRAGKRVGRAVSSAGNQTVVLAREFTESVVGAPRRALARLADSQNRIISSFAKGAQENIASVYMNIVFSMFELYSLADVEDPCFPDQPLLRREKETGIPMAEVNEIYVPAGDSVDLWIEAHDLNSGINPFSVGLKIVDLDAEDDSPYKMETDVFSKGSPARKGFGENPLDEKKRNPIALFREGKIDGAVEALDEEVHNHLQIPFGSLVAKTQATLASLLGIGSMKEQNAPLLFMENKLKRARFHFRLDLRNAGGHVFRLKPFVRDRAGRPSNSGDRFLVSFIRDDCAPVMALGSPAKNKTFRRGETVSVCFVLSDTKSLRSPGAKKTGAASGIRPGDVEIAVYRSGLPAFTRRLNKADIDGKLRRGLIKDPVKITVPVKGLPPGQYDLRVSAVDRAGNRTVNGTVMKKGVTPAKYLFIVGDPRKVMIQASADKTPPYGPGQTVIFDLQVWNNTASTLKRLEMKLQAGKWSEWFEIPADQRDPGLQSILDGKPIDVSIPAGQRMVLPFRLPLRVLVKAGAKSREESLLIKGKAMFDGELEEPVECLLTLPLEGRIPSSTVLFESEISFIDSRGREHPLPNGTRVGVTQIYKYPLIGMGSSGALQSGGSKEVEHFVGFGFVDDSHGHVLCKLNLAGGQTKFRVVAYSQAGARKPSGGRKGIAAVIRRGSRQPYKSVSNEFNVRLSCIRTTKSGVRFIRRDRVLLPGPDKPVLLRYEGALTTDGYINPWGDISPAGGAGAFTMIGQMNNVAGMARAAGSTHAGTIPGLNYKNHNGAFSILSALVKGHLFAESLRMVVSSGSLEQELGDDFIPLLPADTSSNISAYSDTGEENDGERDKHSEEDGGCGKDDRGADVIEAMLADSMSAAEAARKTESLLALLQKVETLGRAVTAAENRALAAESRANGLEPGMQRIEAEEELLKARLFDMRSTLENLGDPGLAGRRAARIAACEKHLERLEIEKAWFVKMKQRLEQERRNAKEEAKQSRNLFSSAHRSLINLEAEIAAMIFPEGASVDSLGDLLPSAALKNYLDYLPKEEIKRRKARRQMKFFLARMKKARVRREIRTKPLSMPGGKEEGIRGQMARWHPAVIDDKRSVPLYRKDRENVYRVIVPPGAGMDSENPYMILRAYAAFIRETFVERTGSQTRHPYFQPIRSSDERKAIEDAWDYGFDTFFASAVLGTPYFVDGYADGRLKIDYESVPPPKGKSLTKHVKRRGLDNPTAVAAMFWMLYERFGSEFLANILGYGRRLHLPRLAAYYPEMNDFFVRLGLVPVIHFETSKGGMPRITWDHNGIVARPRNLDFFVEYSPDPSFTADVQRIDGRGRNFIDLGKALGPEQVGAVLRNRLADGTYYFRVRLDSAFAGGVLGRACSPTGVFVVSRPRKDIDAGGGQVDFAAGTVNGRLEIARGALAGPVGISATSISLPDEAGGYHIVGGGALELQPEGVQYREAARIVFEYDDEDISQVNEDDLFVGRYDEETGNWVPVPTERDSDGNRITGLTRSHSIYALLVDLQPPEMVRSCDGLDPFVPGAEYATIEFKANEPASFVVDIESADGRKIRTIETPFFDTGGGRTAWDGKDNDGRLVPDGLYSYAVRAVDGSRKNSAPVRGSVWAMRGSGGAVCGRVGVVGRRDLSGIKITVDGTTLAADSDEAGEFRIERVPPARVNVSAHLNGYFPEQWKMVSVCSGKTTSIPGRELTNAVVSSASLVSDYVSPDADGENDEMVAEFTLTRPTALSAVILDKRGRTVMELFSRRHYEKGRRMVVWDGRTADGDISRNGRHTLRVYAHTGSVSLLQSELSFVLDTGLAADLIADPSVFSPNGDGLDDTMSAMFTMTASGAASIDIIDSHGASVAVLFKRQELSPGFHTVTWNGRNTEGRDLPDGSYKVRLCSWYPDGFESRSFLAGVILDKTVPELGEMSPANGSVISTGMPEISARLLSPASDVPAGLVRVKIDENTIEPDIYDRASGKISFRPKTSLGEGRHIAIVYARDLAGNEAEPKAVSFNIEFPGDSHDRAAPSINCIQPTRGADVYSMDPSFELRLFDEQSGIDSSSIRLEIDGVRVANSVINYIPGTSGKDWDMWFYQKMKVLYDPLSGRMRYNCLDELKRSDQIEGTHAWTVVVCDRSGRCSAKYHGLFNIRLDEEEPCAKCLEPPNSSIVTSRLGAVSFLLEDEGPSGIDPMRTVIVVDDDYVSAKDATNHFSAEWSLSASDADTSRTSIRLAGLPVDISEAARAALSADNLVVTCRYCCDERAEPGVEAVVRRASGELTGARLSESYLIERTESGLVLRQRVEGWFLHLPPGENVMVSLSRNGKPVDVISSAYDRKNRKYTAVFRALLVPGVDDRLEFTGLDGTLKSRRVPRYRLDYIPKEPFANDADHLAAIIPVDRAGNRGETSATLFTVRMDTRAPVVVDFTPMDGAVLDELHSVSVSFFDRGGSGIDKSSIRFSFDGRRIPPGSIQVKDGAASFTPGGKLPLGEHLVGFSVSDRAGNRSRKDTAVYRLTDDKSPPVVLWFTPRHGSVLDGNIVRIRARLHDEGSGIDPSSIRISVDGRPVDRHAGVFELSTGEFSTYVTLDQAKAINEHLITLYVRDYGGNPLAEPFIAVVTGKRGDAR